MTTGQCWLQRKYWHISCKFSA